MHPARPRFGRLGTQPKANEEGQTQSPVRRKLNASPPDVAQLFTYAMNRKRENG